MVIPDMLSQFSPWPSIGYCYPSCPHNVKLQRSFPASLHQWSRNVSSCQPHHYWLAQGHQGGSSSPLPILATQRDPCHWGWSGPMRWSTCHSSCQKREGLASTASIQPRNNQVTVAHVWKFLLAWQQQGHWRSSLPVWNLQMVPQSACHSAPHTYAHTIIPMADVCHGYLHARRSWLPGSWWFLLEDDIHSMSSTWPEQHQQGCLTAERHVLRAWHPWSPSLWQQPTICECPVCQLLYILGHNTQNLKSTLPTIQWICQGMCQVCQTYTPMSQVQWCWSTACPASTLSYAHWHQASIPSRAVVPMPTQNNHSNQDLQQWPIIHTSPWADQHTLWSCQITGWQTHQNTCTTVCWSTSCNVWHPQENLDSCYCDTCPTMG